MARKTNKMRVQIWLRTTGQTQIRLRKLTQVRKGSYAFFIKSVL